MNVAVLVAPSFDDASRYSYEWSREIRQKLEEKGFNVIDISGREVSRKEVEEALKQNPNALFVFYNHGSRDCLWGSRTEKVVNLGNVKLLSNREVYTLACLSAEKLGVEAYKNNCLAYWGYIREFAFSTEAIEYFKMFANYGLILRLEGKSWDECLKLAKELAKKLASKLAEEGKYFSAVLMSEDAEALVCYNAEMPKTKCPFRKVAVKLLGKKGWHLRDYLKKEYFEYASEATYVISLIIYVASRIQLPLNFSNIDVAFILMTISFLMARAYNEYLEWMLDKWRR
ncbi:MAG: hypothetical protein QXJ07_04890 [Candidatus Bathyarchaeia archaeon]